MHLKQVLSLWNNFSNLGITCGSVRSFEVEVKAVFEKKCPIDTQAKMQTEWRHLNALKYL